MTLGLTDDELIGSSWPGASWSSGSGRDNAAMAQLSLRRAAVGREAATRRDNPRSVMKTRPR